MSMLRWALTLAIALPAAPNAMAQAPQLPEPAITLVREVVYNEIHDHQHHGYWRYRINRRTANGIATEEQVETVGGPVKWVTEGNGQPLEGPARQEEQARLERLINSPQEQAKHLREYNKDEERIGRIVAMLPDAFLYEYEGEESGCYRLHFHPNPDYPSHSIEARIFHTMSGELWVDARYKRLAGLEGHIDQNVDFGFGILGRIYKGGWFKLERTRVSDTDWKTEQLEMHMNIRALLVTSFARETSETRGDFKPVQAGMSVAQGVALLEANESASSARAMQSSLAISR
jgi:hypothetical protein